MNFAKTTFTRQLFLACLLASLGSVAGGQEGRDSKKETRNPLPLRVAAEPALAGVTTIYKQNSHADVIFTRLLETDTMDGQGRKLACSLRSAFVMQQPTADLSKTLAEKHSFPIASTVRQALLGGHDKLTVDGVLMVAEHGDFPKSKYGQKLYPKRELFTQIANTMQAAGQATPVFIDKMLADNWEDAAWIYQRAKTLGIPLMAGSSVPAAWRYPPVDIPKDAKVKEIVVVSYGSPDSYGFHALEVAQCLAERRAGGETGVASVRCLQGADVWVAADDLYSKSLLVRAMSHNAPPTDFDAREFAREPVQWEKLKKRVKSPWLCHVVYQDQTRVNVLVLNGAARHWSAGWQLADDTVGGTHFWVHNGRPYMHFSNLLDGVSKMMTTGKPTWPVERTLLTTQIHHAAFRSAAARGTAVQSQRLQVKYLPTWQWTQPDWPQRISR